MQRNTQWTAALMGIGAAAALLLPTAGASAAPAGRKGDDKNGRPIVVARTDRQTWGKDSRPVVRSDKDRQVANRDNDRNDKDRPVANRDNDRKDKDRPVANRDNDRNDKDRPAYNRDNDRKDYDRGNDRKDYDRDNDRRDCDRRDGDGVFVGHAENVDRIRGHMDIYISGVGTFDVDIRSMRVTYGGRRASFQDMVGGYPIRIYGERRGGVIRASVVDIDL